jgi:hypothetical protein
MTDHDLSDLLERLGERTSVGPPPTDAMLAGASRDRRRRTAWLAAGAAAAVAVTVGGVALLGSSSDPAGNGPADPSPTSFVTPPGTRLVGVGHAAIAVPEEWGTNRVICANPHEDTVVIDLGAVCLAYHPRPRGVESVEVVPGWYGGFGEQSEVETESFEVDGEPAERVATACPTEDADYTFCRGAVYLPDQDVTFLAESTSRGGRAKVAEILSWIKVVPGLVGVPGYQDVNYGWYHQKISPSEHYADAVEALGLRVEVVAEEDQVRKEGSVLRVEPRPGTMAAPGSVVTVTEVVRPR